MKNRVMSFNRDIVIISFSLILCGISFVFDLMIPWAIGSVLYIPAILLSLRTRRPKDLAIYLSALVSILTIVNLFIQHPQVHALRIITNHFMAIVIVWSIALMGVFYKRENETKAYLAAIVDSSRDGIIGRTLDGIVTSWNIGAEMLYGYKAQEIIGKSISTLTPENNYSDEGSVLGHIKEGHRVFNFETVRRKKDGQLIHVSLTLSPIEDSMGGIVGISSIAKDITKRIEIENQLKTLNQRVYLEKEKLEEVLSIEEHLNTIFNVDRLADFIVEKTAKVLDAERCSLMFYDEHSFSLHLKASKGVDEQYLSILRNVEDPEYISSWVARESKVLLVEDVETDERFSRSNRSSYKTKSFCSVPIKLGQKLMGVINVADKIAKNQKAFTDLDVKILSMIVRQVAIALENAKLYREMKYLTITDPLTHINNFRQFSKSLDYEISRMKRFPANLSLLMIDVDCFKSYNDTFGHLEGDEALKKIGKAIAKNVREVDVACRYAGDEFAVILPGASFQEASIVARKLKHVVSSLDLKRKLTLSIGIGSFAHGMVKYDLIQKADVALYQAKKENKSDAGQSLKLTNNRT